MSDLTRLDVGYLTEAVQELTRAMVDVRDTSARLNALEEWKSERSQTTFAQAVALDATQHEEMFGRLSRLEEWKRDHEAERHDRINLIGDPTPVDNPPAQVDKADSGADALRARCEGLTRALEEADASLDQLWAAIGDALCSGSGISVEYGQSVSVQVTEARKRTRRALLDAARGDGDV